MVNGRVATLLIRIKKLHKYLFTDFFQVFIITTRKDQIDISSYFIPCSVLSSTCRFLDTLPIKLKKIYWVQRYFNPIYKEKLYSITRRVKRCVVLLDDLVLDTTDYAASILEESLFLKGREERILVSPFWWLQPRTTKWPKYNYTNYVRIACNSLIIRKTRTHFKKMYCSHYWRIQRLKIVWSKRLSLNLWLEKFFLLKSNFSTRLTTLGNTF